MKRLHELARGNTHLHVMNTQLVTNEMGTIYLAVNAQPCNNPECEQVEALDVVWLHDHHRFVMRTLDLNDENYTKGYEDGYEHALEVHGIEEVD